jgi:hypothetical protein
MIARAPTRCGSRSVIHGGPRGDDQRVVEPGGFSNAHHSDALPGRGWQPLMSPIGRAPRRRESSVEEDSTRSKTSHGETANSIGGVALVDFQISPFPERKFGWGSTERASGTRRCGASRAAIFCCCSAISAAVRAANDTESVMVISGMAFSPTCVPACSSSAWSNRF